MTDSPVVPLLAAGGGALLTALAVTPVVRRLATRAGLLDYPDGRRKLQSQPVPKAGGLAVLVASLAALVGVALLWPDLGGVLENGGQVWSLLGATLFIALVGLADDAWDLRGRYKLLGQLVAISMLVFPGGLYVDTVNLFGLRLELGVLGLGFTVFWMLACINALNLIDGMDGLLGVVGTIVCLTLAVIGVLSGKWAVALIGAALAGSLVGFLVFNLPPARVYLGDSGSMVIGLVVGAVSVESCLKGPTAVALVVPASLLVIPILDTGAALLRRVLTGRSIYISDRGHLHHCLLRNGLTRGQVLVFVGSLGVVAAAGAILSHTFRTDTFAVLGAAAVTGILVASRQFGTAELRLVSERVRAVLAASLHGGAAGRSHNLEVRLQGSAAWDGIWLRLTEAGEGLRLRGLQLDVNLPAIHEGYHARWQRFGATGNEAALWRAEVPLFMGDQVIGRLTAVGCRDGGSAWHKLARLATIVAQAEEEASVLAAGERLPAAGRPAPALQSIA